MLWHIIKREIYDHFTSLRFALTVGLITLLMALNALIFVSSDYKQRMREYSQNIAWVADKVKASSKYLNELAQQGPVGFYKRPSPLAFCANDQEDALPIRIHAAGANYQNGWGGSLERSYYYRPPWKLEYIQDTYQENSMLQTFTALDWSFIISVVMSFVAILFTYDAISGERERGTLALTLSNAVPRGVILLAKFLGVFIAIVVPMLMGILLNLLIVNLSGVVSLSGNGWAQIGLMAVISFIYISLFIGLGLAISSRMAHSSTSLLVLLLIWVVLVVLVPNTLGSVVSTLRKVPSQREFQQRRDSMMQPFWNWNKSDKELFKYGSPTQPNPNIKAIELMANYITARMETESRLDDEHLDAQFAQVQSARKILRASPTTIYNYAMETLAGTGFEQHQQFVQAVRRYRSQFIEFIKTADRADPESFHVYYLKEGLSSKPVGFDNVPRFVEPTGVGLAAKNALMDLSLLLLFSALLFLASYLAFLRCDVR
jgi:ABC-type transport system involved in multi-copper enzyme maturation permease subunit